MFALIPNICSLVRAGAFTTALALTATAVAAAAPLPIPHHLSGRIHTDAAASSTALNGPEGLTIAPNGDLYVANFNGSTVTVYGSNLVQKPSATIYAGLDFPDGLAFSSAGILWVSNYTGNNITAYDTNHNLLSNLTRSGAGGWGIAFDALDDMYVSGVLNTSAGNGSGAINYYRVDGSFEAQFLQPNDAYPYYVATSKHFIAYGGSDFGSGSTLSAYYSYVQLQLASTGQRYAPGYGWAAHSVTGLAFDSNEKLYVAEGDQNAVGIFTPLANTFVPFLKLGFSPGGIAVDLAHNHVFVSDTAHNAIAVFTAAGQPLTVLH
jgi:DNA-binding beta-propeller fold protein YncE